MEDYLPEWEAQKQPKKSIFPYILGCLGCFGLVFFLAIVVAVFGVRWGINYALEEISAEQPLVVEVVEGTYEEIQAVQDKVGEWLALPLDDETPLELSAREVNIFVQNDEEFQEIFEVFHLEIDADVVTMQFSIPLSAGQTTRYFNADFTGQVEFYDFMPAIDIQEGYVGTGKSIFDLFGGGAGEAFDDGMAIMNLFMFNDKLAGKVFEIGTLKVEDGEVRITRGTPFGEVSW